MHNRMLIAMKCYVKNVENESHKLNSCSGNCWLKVLISQKKKSTAHIENVCICS